MDYRRMTPRHALIGTVVTWYALASVIFAFSLIPTRQLQVMSDLSMTAVALIAGISCLSRSRSVLEPRTRSAWVLLGAAATAWALGQAGTSYFEVLLDEAAPFPSMAEAGYLAAVPLFALGLLHLAAPASRPAVRIRLVLDGLLISIALLLVSWVTVLGPVAYSSTGSPVSKVILIAYPAGDVALVTLVVYVMLRVRATGVRPAVPLSL